MVQSIEIKILKDLSWLHKKFIVLRPPLDRDLRFCRNLSFANMNRFLSSKRLSQSTVNFWRWLGIAISTAILCSNLFWISAAIGQIPGLNPQPASKSQSNPSASSSPPPWVEKFTQNLSSDPNYIAQSIYLDGRRIFGVAVPESNPQKTSSGESTESTSISNRAQIIQSRLQKIAQDNLDTNTLEVEYQIDPDSQLPLIYVNDNYLMTVTSNDAVMRGDDLETTAQELAQIIKDALLVYNRERQPEYLKRQGLIAGGIVLGIIVLTLGILYRKRHLQALYHKTLAQLESSPSSPTNPYEQNLDQIPDSPDQATVLAQQQLAKRKKIKVWQELRQRLLTFGLIGIWVGGLAIGLRLFPQTRWLQSLVLSGLGEILLKILVIIVATYWAIRISFVLTDWVFTLLSKSSLLPSQASVRKLQRLQTVSGVTKGMITILMGITGCLIALSTLGVNIGPLLAGVGIIGVAISLGAQNLVKDMINGFFILLEDQYSVGDVITLGDASGLVEKMNLRITQLRSIDGELITLPNSSISEVRNHTNQWSRANLVIAVGYHTNLDQAITLIDTVAQQMAQEQPWQNLILEPPTVLGVDEFKENFLTIRLWIRTKPLKQWDVGREYRRRLKNAFDREGISIPLPHRTVHLENPQEFINVNGRK